MTRKEGILKAWKEEKKLPLPAQKETQLLNFEYNQYLEACLSCYEDPLKKEIWLNQTINPAK